MDNANLSGFIGRHIEWKHPMAKDWSKGVIRGVKLDAEDDVILFVQSDDDGLLCKVANVNCVVKIRA